MVMSNILSLLDPGNAGLLVLLDLSAACDSVDCGPQHTTLEDVCFLWHGWGVTK